MANDILIVDDEADICKLIAGILEDALRKPGFECEPDLLSRLGYGSFELMPVYRRDRDHRILQPFGQLVHRGLPRHFRQQPAGGLTAFIDFGLVTLRCLAQPLRRQGL